MLCGKIERFKKVAEIAHKGFMDYREYLETGRYGVKYEGKILIYSKKKLSIDCHKFIKKNSIQLGLRNDFSNKIRSIYGKIALSKFDFINRTPGNVDAKFHAQLLMITNSNDFKLFDFENMTLKNFFSHEETYSIIKKAYHSMSPFFNTTIISFNDDKKCITEKIVRFIPYQEWTDTMVEQCVNEIGLSYTNYFSTITIEIKRNDFDAIATVSKLFKSQLPCEETKKRIADILTKNTSIKLCNAFLHGDMKLRNILRCGEKFSVIDFERSRNLVFFYDFFDLIFTELFVRNDPRLMDNLFLGNYDRILALLFNSLELTFNPNMKQYYVACYLAQKAIEFDALCVYPIQFYRTYLMILESFNNI